MSDCIFCRIVTDEVPASFVHRDELISAFLDIRPVTPGHLLVIPNEHVVFTHDLPDLVADRHTDTIQAECVNLFVADGEAAEQEVSHAHLHVIPRFAGDGFVLMRRPGAIRRRPVKCSTLGQYGSEATSRSRLTVRDPAATPPERPASQVRTYGDSGHVSRTPESSHHV